MSRDLRRILWAVVFILAISLSRHATGLLASVPMAICALVLAFLSVPNKEK